MYRYACTTSITINPYLPLIVRLHAIHTTVSRQILHHGLENDFIASASDNPSWLQRSWPRCDLCIIQEMSVHLRSRRPNGLLHRGAVREEGECLPSHAPPPVPAEQRHAIFRLRCKYSVQVRKGSQRPARSEGRERGRRRYVPAT